MCLTHTAALAARLYGRRPAAQGLAAAPHCKGLFIDFQKLGRSAEDLCRVPVARLVARRLLADAQWRAFLKISRGGSFRGRRKGRAESSWGGRRGDSEDFVGCVGLAIYLLGVQGSCG